MWILYITWIFSAPDESRIAVYEHREQCVIEQQVAMKDNRVKSARCVFRTDLLKQG